MSVPVLDVAPDCQVRVADQVWARPLPDGRWEVGITPLGLQLSGEVYMCRVKAVGSRVQAGHGLGVVELAKSIVSVKSPLDGVIDELNPALVPEDLPRDPCGAGWLARLREVPPAHGLLPAGDALRAAQAAHAALFPEVFGA